MVTGTASSQGARSKLDDDTSFLQEDVLDVVPLAMSALGFSLYADGSSEDGHS